MSTKRKQTPVTYTDVLDNVEAEYSKLQDILFRFELTKFAQFIKTKYQDTRSIPELMGIIVEELLNGEWDYKKYLYSKRSYSAPQ